MMVIHIALPHPDIMGWDTILICAWLASKYLERNEEDEG
jgi:hypothetical protein